MSEIRLVVSEAERDWSGTTHGSWADRATAALSADPLTLEELEHATEHFARPTPSASRGRLRAVASSEICRQRAVKIKTSRGLKTGGRVPVQLHLLGPNHKPQQITEGLTSFWKETYTLVRKELRRRYPKHHWPEDPTTAAATPRGVKPKA